MKIESKYPIDIGERINVYSFQSSFIQIERGHTHVIGSREIVFLKMNKL